MKTDYLLGFGLLMVIMGVAGIAGAIELGNGLMLALIMSIGGVVMTATGLYKEKKE